MKNVLCYVGAALVAATLSVDFAAAQTPASGNAGTGRSARVVVECGSKHSPPLADVARVVGTGYDLWATFVARQRLIALAQPACARGTDLVEFIAGADFDVRDLHGAVAAVDVR